MDPSFHEMTAMLIRPQITAHPLRRAIPVVLIVLGLWGLAGCFSMPISEHGTDTAQKDFRGMLDNPKSPTPILRGTATRATVVAILGQPARE